MKKIKKILKYTAYGTAGCGALMCLILAAYYFLMFKNPNPLSFFVPESVGIFISVHKPDDVAGALKTYLPEHIQKEFASEGRIPSAGLLGFLLGDEAVFFTASGSWGITAKISFPAKLALLFPGLVTGSEISETSLRGNKVSVLTFSKTPYYLSKKWNILSITPSKEIAGLTAELLNRRPVIAPLALNEDVREIISGKEESSEVYLSCEDYFAGTLFQSELGALSSVGGIFTVSQQEIDALLRVKGVLGNPEDTLQLPEYSKAFFVASFPCDINTMWRDFCSKVEGNGFKYSSFTVTLTSEIFDAVVKTLKPAVFIYGFKGEKTGLSPSGVLCLEAGKGVSEQKCAALLKEFITKAQALNGERVKISKVQKLTYTMRKTKYDGVSVYYIDIKPLAASNFIPGFCLLGNRILVATDQRELKHVLPYIKQKTEPVQKGYYVRITDSGLGTLFDFLKRSLNDPSRKQRMGEAGFAQAIDRVNSAEKWSQGIGEITMQEKGMSPPFRALGIEIKPVSSQDKPVNSKFQNPNSK